MNKENLYTTDCIRTFTGKYVNVFEPQKDMFCIEDIAHSLSHQCRFGGHLPVFYSVAQHSLMVSLYVPDADALAGLLHDASEAYLLDFPKPIKDRMVEYKGIEDTLMRTIALQLGFEYPLKESIKAADKFALEYEWENVFLKQTLEILTPIKAKELFIDRYNLLTL